MSRIPIVEIFPTCQMEGPGLGIPSLFVRVGGCDLRCRFRGTACDTPYAVYTPAQLDEKDPSLKYGYDKWYPTEIDQLAHIIEGQPLKNIVLSGGHPFLYLDSLTDLISKLTKLDKGYTFEFETQGTIPVNNRLRGHQNVIYNVSVKLSSSNQEPGYDIKRINWDALRSFPKEKSVYKFVITNPDQDLQEIRDILNICELPVYVMPEGMTRVDVIANSSAVVDLAIKNGWRFSPRLHIMIWDTKKGV